MAQASSSKSDKPMSAEEVKATEAAAKLAEKEGIDLAEVEPSGADGNIIVDDVKATAEEMQQEEATYAEYVCNPELGASVAGVVGFIDGSEVYFAQGVPKLLTVAQYRQVENETVRDKQAIIRREV